MKAFRVLLVCLAACGAEEDTRPLTAEYVVATVLAPTCGRGGCHSSQTAWEGYAFDTLPAAIRAFDELVSPGRPNRSPLVSVLEGDDEPMPPEGPLPQADIDYIRRWIEAGAEGAQ